MRKLRALFWVLAALLTFALVHAPPTQAAMMDFGDEMNFAAILTATEENSPTTHVIVAETPTQARTSNVGWAIRAELPTMTMASLPRQTGRLPNSRDRPNFDSFATYSMTTHLSVLRV